MTNLEAREYIRLKMREKLATPERTAYGCLHEILMEELTHDGCERDGARIAPIGE
jgi:hypothetical protein